MLPRGTQHLLLAHPYKTGFLVSFLLLNLIGRANSFCSPARLPASPLSPTHSCFLRHRHPSFSVSPRSLNGILSVQMASEEKEKTVADTTPAVAFDEA
eukprot:774852-Rhodomonas_salina.1